ncbi:hypothetical protein A3A39_03575 [Candidatus Kaiserbacteria bacterium RIFCSPLOWO2_01_FULL_54_13]|uniref:Colicin V production protein n=1 Tax=Candidatus Kaiserbacteria bacterium RIFCSPLOWO2_01_FULL_54_13 TaxID=1798512 RepID=A0A1F6EZX9_9BACT|nr:MAG: hypothetical protein A3A39_03575 [Candidatus Kaiserbacteria bacterium RIFCSPLOWO2_01_FULL_54_13]
MNLDSLTSLFAAVPTDWMIIGSFAILAAFDCVRSGARRVCTLALALPPTVILAESLSKAEILGGITGQFSTPMLEAVLFGILLVGMYVLIARIGLSWGEEAGQTIQAALAGVALTAIVVTIWIATPALDQLWNFGPQVQQIFGESYRFFWLLGSFAALAFVRS